MSKTTQSTETTYQIFDDFLQQVIIEKKSFIFDNEVDISPKFDNMVINEIIEKYIKSPIRNEKDVAKLVKQSINNANHPDIKAFNLLESLKEKDQNKKSLSYTDKINNQFEESEKNVKILFADILFLRYLPIADMTMKSKLDKIKGFFVDTEIKNLNNELKGIATYGMAQQQIDNEMVHLVALFDYLLSDENQCDETIIKENKVNKVKNLIIDWIFDEKGYVFGQSNGKKEDNHVKTKFFENTNNVIRYQYFDNSKQVERIKDKNARLPIHNMLLHLCDPSNYEPIAIQNHKYTIVEKLYEVYVKEGDKAKKLPEDYKPKKSKDNIEVCNNKVDIYIKEIKDAIIKNDKDFKSFWDEPYYSQWNDGYVATSFKILNDYKKQIIMYGSPGTGKTFNAKKVVEDFILKHDYESLSNTSTEYDNESSGYKINTKAYKFKAINTFEGKQVDEKVSEDHCNNENKVNSKYQLCDDVKDRNVIWEMVQFNQSFSYEDFIEGMRPNENGALKIVDGIFKKFVKTASLYSEKKFILIIDEINRGKIDKIFGELIYLLEYRNEPLKLHYSGEDFSIPDNLYIIGTMNTADKSIALLDVALRRRFWFVKCLPDEKVLIKEFKISSDEKATVNDTPENVKVLAFKLFQKLNKDILNFNNFGSDAEEIKIGHSYFLKLIRKDEGNEIEPSFMDLKNIWFYSIIPLLEEYCQFDRNRLSEILKFDKMDLSKKEIFILNNLSTLF